MWAYGQALIVLPSLQEERGRGMEALTCGGSWTWLLFCGLLGNPRGQEKQPLVHNRKFDSVSQAGAKRRGHAL